MPPPYYYRKHGIYNAYSVKRTKKDTLNTFFEVLKNNRIKDYSVSPTSLHKLLT